MQRALLLDMDGVITRSPRISHIVQDRVCSFVSNRLHMCHHKARRVNEHLYNQFGHTLIGMQKLYDPSITLTDFCSYVYDKRFLNTIEPSVEELKTFNLFLEKVKDKQVPVYIFSNANKDWCVHMLQTDTIPIISCDHFIFDDRAAPDVCLKPNLCTYLKVMKYLKAQNYIFVDDSIKNLLPIISHKNWKAVWMNNCPINKENIDSVSLHTINELDQLFISL